MELKLSIPEEPQAMARAKTTSKCINGRWKTWSYTPTPSKLAMESLKCAIYTKVKEQFPAYMPLELTVTFYRTKPDSSKDAMPVRKPDLSNLIKGVEDVMNKIVYPDDAAIVKEVLVKKWSTTGHGYIEIELKEYKDDSI